MEVNLDQKQLLLLGYLRDLLTSSNLKDYQLFDDDEPHDHATRPGRMSPMLTPTASPMFTPLSKLDEHMTLFTFNAPQTQIPQSPSEICGNSDPIMLDIPKRSQMLALPSNVIQSIYFYYNRCQNYLFLLSGSEECKDNSYNQIQIINLRNVSDIDQNIDYPYTNYRLQPHFWKNRINYNKYFQKSLQKYPIGTSQSVVTPQPLTVAFSPDTPEPALSQSATHTIQINSPASPKNKSPWNAMNNSAFSPLAQVLKNPSIENSALSPFAIINEYKMKSRPRAKSTSKIKVLKKKDIAKIKAAKSKKLKTKKSSKNFKSKRKRKSTMPYDKPPDTSMMSKSKSLRTSAMDSPDMFMMSKSKSLHTSPMKSKKKKKGKIVKNPVTYTRDFDRYSFGECMVSISNEMNGSVPQWPWFMAKYKADVRVQTCINRYKMYIRCGGIHTKDDEYTNQNDLFLFNASNLNDIGREIDSYYCQLPKFKKSMESPAIVYNGLDRILSFGGYSYDDGKPSKMIYSLNLNTDKIKKFKWQKYGNVINKARYDASVVHVKGRNKFVIIGGKGTTTKPIDSVEMFDASKKTSKNKSAKCIPLADLHFKRFKPGSCLVQSKLAVAGGILYGKGVNSIELYDLHKNEWIVHATEMLYGHQHPTMYTHAQINPNMLYIAGNNISFGAKKGSLGFVEWCDLRENKKKCNMLYTEPIEELYELWGIRPNIWEPRSLLHFML
eukprot:250738_1